MNKFTRSQFVGSTYGKPVLISGKVALSVPSQASLVVQDITYTSVAFESSANNITIAYTAGGVAGSEVVTVTGNAISIQIQSGVSTATQVKAAFDASAPATALATSAISGVAGNAQIAAVAAPLVGGTNGVGANNFGELVSSIDRTGVGQYTIYLADTYNQPQSVVCRLLAATAVDLIPQLKSVNVVSTKTIVVSLLAGATPTELAASVTLSMDAILNASSIYY